MNTFCHFGLIVTGKGEERFLPKLFRVLPAHARCAFYVIRRIGQRSPITSQKRRLEMVGRGQVLPTRDEDEIGLPARRFLNERNASFVILVDDIEAGRRGCVEKVFQRYRTCLDVMLVQPDLRERASVHFFANMLEAYYFAHAAAVNAAAETDILGDDHPGDVEDMKHPKNRLKELWEGFDEIEHGEQIVARLDIPHVLHRPQECCWLRSLFAWCAEKLQGEDAIYKPELMGLFQLRDGCRAELTRHQ